MNYPLKNSFISGSRSTRNRYKKPIQISVAVIVVLFLLRIVFPTFLFSFLSALYTPLWKAGDAIGFNEYITTRSSLVAENSNLKEQITSLSGSSDAIALLEQENAELKQMLGRTMPKLVLAAVLKMPPLSDYDNLLIDVGTHEGVNVGDKVYALVGPTPPIVSSSSLATSTGVLMPIGVVAQVSPQTASVNLYSSSGQKYVVQIGPDHIIATANAQGGGMFEADLAQGANVHQGDVVTVPSIQSVTFGTVGAIVNDPARPYMSVYFQEPVNIFQLRWVEVGKE